MFRNREIRQFAIVFLSIALISIIVGFNINKAALILVSASSVLFGTAFFMFTRARYKSISQISAQIDKVLHNEEYLYIGELEEGELSILNSEITKMTLRLREQNEALKKEKRHLSNSLADIAHQLRTPLTSANIILSLLENNNNEKERRAFVRETEELLLKMDWLLTSLLKLSRLDAELVILKKEQVEVKKLIFEAVRPLLIPMELHEIELKVDVPSEIVIQGDLNWLSEAIQNIFKNCMESVGDKGKLEVTCTENPIFTEIVIHDSGSGFKQEDLPHIFERFYRGNSKNATGYGIGLSLCKMIIVRQGGTIVAKNHPQGGASFVLRFPK